MKLIYTHAHEYRLLEAWFVHESEIKILPAAAHITIIVGSLVRYPMEFNLLGPHCFNNH